MSEITTIGLDLAKHVFQVHGIDAQGTTVLRKRLRRGQLLAFFSRIPRCVVGLEACATAHYWARELGALGHEVRPKRPSSFMGTNEIETAILSVATPGVEPGELEEARHMARELNEFAAKVVADHPDRFGFMPAVNV
jgi:hypothetical protein